MVLIAKHAPIVEQLLEILQKFKIAMQQHIQQVHKQLLAQNANLDFNLLLQLHVLLVHLLVQLAQHQLQLVQHAYLDIIYLVTLVEQSLLQWQIAKLTPVQLHVEHVIPSLHQHRPQFVMHVLTQIAQHALLQKVLVQHVQELGMLMLVLVLL